MKKKIIVLLGLAMLANACSPKSNSKDESPAPAAAEDKAKGKPAPAVAKGKPVSKPATQPPSTPVIAEATEDQELPEETAPVTFSGYAKDLESQKLAAQKAIFGSWYSQQEMEFPGFLKTGDPWESEPLLEVNLCTVTAAGTSREKEICKELTEVTTPNNDMSVDIVVVQANSSYQITIQEILDTAKGLGSSNHYYLKFLYLRKTGKSETKLTNRQIAASGSIDLDRVIKYSSNGDDQKILLFSHAMKGGVGKSGTPVGVVSINIGSAL